VQMAADAAVQGDAARAQVDPGVAVQRAQQPHRVAAAVVARAQHQRARAGIQLGAGADDHARAAATFAAQLDAAIAGQHHALADHQAVGGRGGAAAAQVDVPAVGGDVAFLQLQAGVQPDAGHGDRASGGGNAAGAAEQHAGAVDRAAEQRNVAGAAVDRDAVHVHADRTDARGGADDREHALDVHAAGAVGTADQDDAEGRAVAGDVDVAARAVDADGVVGVTDGNRDAAALLAVADQGDRAAGAGNPAV